LSAIEARDLWGNAKKDVREKFLRFSLGFTGFKLAEICCEKVGHDTNSLRLI